MFLKAVTVAIALGCVTAQKHEASSYASVNFGGDGHQSYDHQPAQYQAAPVAQHHEAPPSVAQYHAAQPSVAQYHAAQPSGAQYHVANSVVPAAHHQTLPVAQYNAAPQPQHHAAPAVQYHVAHQSQHHAAPVAQYHVAPVAQYHAAPVAQYHVAPQTQHHAAPVAEYHAAPVSQYHVSPQPQHHAAPVAHHVAPVAHHAAPVSHHEEYPDAHPRYVFQYGIKDSHTGDVHNQQEERDGEVVKGEYSLLQPDGITRIVRYTADKSGFNAKVEYSGHASHPEAVHKSVAPEPVVQVQQKQQDHVHHAYHQGYHH